MGKHKLSENEHKLTYMIINNKWVICGKTYKVLLHKKHGKESVLKRETDIREIATYRDTERHRETQRDTERHREAQRDTERHRETQRDTERHRDRKRMTKRQRLTWIPVYIFALFACFDAFYCFSACLPLLSLSLSFFLSQPSTCIAQAPKLARGMHRQKLRSIFLPFYDLFLSVSVVFLFVSDPVPR